MSYKVIAEIKRSVKTDWSKERGGRKYQYIGNKKVPKYAYSPFTSKAKTDYTFYADITVKGSKYPQATADQDQAEKIGYFTVPVYVGTYIGFRDSILSGEVQEKVEAIASVGGGEIIDVSYWRNKGERRVE